MSTVILYWGLSVAQLFLSIAMFFTIYRVAIGPRAQDRIVALDALYLIVMMLFITFGMRTGTTIYFEASLVIGLLGFVSTVALAKFLMRGEVIE